jgi:hypothetical protein
MATINYAAREINVKIVYYGPALSGKTTNLQIIHKKVPQDSKGDMVSLATESDRTLFFDFLPIDLGKIKGFTTKIQLYTVPGQVYYNATRKLVLRGVDGIVFVADSAKDKMDENIESLDNMEENLSEYGYSLTTIPLVLQYNKRDCDDPMGIEELNQKLNRHSSKWVAAVAMTGEGVFDTLKVISKEVIDILNKKYEGAASAKPQAEEDEFVQEVETAPAAPAVAPAPVKPAPVKADPIPDFKAKEEVAEQDFIELDLDIEPTPAAVSTPVPPPIVESAPQEEFDLDFEDSVEEAAKPQAAQVQADEDFFEADLELENMFDGQSAPVVATKPETSPVAEAQSIISDGLDDDFEISAPKQTSEEAQAVDPIRAALERGKADSLMPPAKMHFSSMNKGGQIDRTSVQKKMPINPKYQKSFMDNLFKKNKDEE